MKEDFAKRSQTTTTNSRDSWLTPLYSRDFGFSRPWFEDFMQPQRWLDHAIDREMDLFRSESRLLSPAIDIDETEKDFIVSADLPGVKKEDVSIDHSGNRLTISAERKYDSSSERKNERRERFHGTYQRSFTLPEGIDAEKIEASFEGGVLQVHIPKGTKSQSRRIEIQDQQQKNKMTKADKMSAIEKH